MLSLQENGLASTLHNLIDILYKQQQQQQEKKSWNIKKHTIPTEQNLIHRTQHLITTSTVHTRSLQVHSPSFSNSCLQNFELQVFFQLRKDSVIFFSHHTPDIITITKWIITNHTIWLHYFFARFSEAIRYWKTYEDLDLSDSFTFPKKFLDYY